METGMTDDSTWPPRFEAVLREHLNRLPPEADLTGDLSMADAGLNSLGTVNLLVALEDEFGVLFPDELLAASTFETPAALWKVLREIQ
jgi:acyl carrier protein